MHHHSDSRVLLFDVTSIYMGPKEAFALLFLMTSIPQDRLLTLFNIDVNNFIITLMSIEI
jgi:hypothetical protein